MKGKAADYHMLVRMIREIKVPKLSAQRPGLWMAARLELTLF